MIEFYDADWIGLIDFDLEVGLGQRDAFIIKEPVLVQKH